MNEFHEMMALNQNKVHRQRVCQNNNLGDYIGYHAAETRYQIDGEEPSFDVTIVGTKGMVEQRFLGDRWQRIERVIMFRE